MIKQIFLSDSTDQLDMKQLIFAEINGVSVNGKMISDALDDNALSLVENAKTYVPENSNDGFKDYLLDNALKQAHLTLLQYKACGAIHFHP